MAVDVTKLPLYIVEVLAHRLSKDDDKGLSVPEVIAKVNGMSVEEVFDEYLAWHGIIGYTHQLITALKGIERAAEPF